MKKHMIFKINAIFWGVFLIALAGLFIACQTGIIQGNTYLVIMTAIFGAIGLRSLIGFNFVPLGFAVGHLALLYRGYLGIPETLKAWMLIVAAMVVGIGLELIFGGLKKHIKKKIKDSRNDGDIEKIPDVRYNEVNNDACNNSSSNFGNSDTSYISGETITIKNGFGAQNRYVRSEDFYSATVENGMGAVNLYFNDVKLANGRADLTIENGMGSVNVYMPAEWSINLSQESAFGQVKIVGNPSTDPNAPCINAHVENGMGQVCLYFQ